MRSTAWTLSGLALALFGPGLVALAWKRATAEAVSVAASAPWLVAFALLPFFLEQHDLSLERTGVVRRISSSFKDESKSCGDQYGIHVVIYFVVYCTVAIYFAVADREEFFAPAPGRTEWKGLAISADAPGALRAGAAGLW